MNALENDTEPKVILTPEQEERLLAFMETDNIYSKYYDEVVLLLETGLRISEFCGLTTHIDMQNRILNIAHKDKLPNITQHSFRHTYCTNMANRGMNPNTLQYLMGHANITMTLGYYAHGTFQSAKAELERLACKYRNIYLLLLDAFTNL